MQVVRAALIAGHQDVIHMRMIRLPGEADIVALLRVDLPAVARDPAVR